MFGVKLHSAEDVDAKTLISSKQYNNGQQPNQVTSQYGSPDSKRGPSCAQGHSKQQAMFLNLLGMLALESS